MNTKYTFDNVVVFIPAQYVSHFNKLTKVRDAVELKCCEDVEISLLAETDIPHACNTEYSMQALRTGLRNSLHDRLLKADPKTPYGEDTVMYDGRNFKHTLSFDLVPDSVQTLSKVWEDIHK